MPICTSLLSAVDCSNVLSATGLLSGTVVFSAIVLCGSVLVWCEPSVSNLRLCSGCDDVERGVGFVRILFF